MKFKAHLAVAVLMILGSAVLTNQISQPLTIIQSKADVEQNDDSKSTDSDDAVLVLQANLAINSYSQVTLHQELHQIREIFLDEVTDHQPVHVVKKITETDHFKTLFRNVISTNAP
jgi:hypothetical protein